jgi:RNA polymerase sigma factor (TIGR02999 family)
MTYVQFGVNCPPMNDVTNILAAIESGDPQAAEHLLPLVYDELRKLAAARMAAERPDHTLDATALVHEAYVRLVGPASAPAWNGRSHFFAAAAEAMRRILVESARQQNSLKRGGGRDRVALDPALEMSQESSDELIALDEALSLLSKEDSLAAELVKLRYFGGLTSEQAAVSLGMSSRSADRTWAYARAWLFKKLHG